MGYTLNRKDSAARRTELRNNPTTPEHRLWQALRNEQLGVKFRRQHSIDRYIADFYSAEAKLVIEVDGNSHYANEAAKAHDRARDDFFGQLGLLVIRVTNTDVMKNLDGVLAHITSVLQQHER